MTAAAALETTRDPFMPRRPPGMRSGLALALLAHALLIAGLAYSVDWHTDEPVAVEAELWSAVPQRAAPRPVEAPPPSPSPAPAPAPAPAPKPPPAPPAPPPQIDPQIAIEKAREAKRVEAQAEVAEQQEKARKERARRDLQVRQEADRRAAEQAAREEAQRKKQAADRQLAQKQQAEKADRARAEPSQAEQAKAEQAEAAKREAARQAYLKRSLALAGATGDASATGSAAKSSGPSASYGGRIVARIKPNIVFPDAVDGNPKASVELRVAPDGTITARRLVQSSGVKAWDDAVLRAVDRTDGLPRDIDGRVPPVVLIDFKPRDL